MAYKKVILIIVEGPSDDTALAVILGRLFDKNHVHVYIHHGDITTDRDSSTTNIASKIGDIVKLCMSAYPFKHSDFQEIIHIVDTDGCFIPDSSVFQDEESRKPFYQEDAIRTNNPRGIIDRNHKKRAILALLNSRNIIYRIPYRVFFMSCNLDHVLFDKPNSSDKDKECDARSFARKYLNDIPGFVTFITSPDITVINDYTKSWLYISQELHSLQRHSNVSLLLPNTAD